MNYYLYKSCHFGTEKHIFKIIYVENVLDFMVPKNIIITAVIALQENKICRHTKYLWKSE